VIIEATGKNVHPDEVEERYRAPELIRELCAVGLPDGTAEKVALLVVPEWKDRPRAEVKAEVEAHLKKISAEMPFHMRARVWHLVDFELPRTATRKVKRALVREELQKLEAAAARGAGARRAREEGGDAWLLDLLAEVSRRPREAVTARARLQGDLGFDSLMLTELTAALEEAGVSAHVAEQLHAVQTVEDLSRLVAGAVKRGEAHPPAPRKPTRPGEERELEVPPQLAKLGRRLLSAGQRLLYQGLYETAVVGAGHVPHDRNVLVVSNHQSHLDMGLVKIALGEEGERLAALAARDYFFDTKLKRAYFNHFTNLIPMDREGSLKASLRSAVETLRRGYHLLIFPEGTRSRDGELHPFFPTAGYLALTAEVDVLPVHLSGTHEVLPPGGHVGQLVASAIRHEPLEVRIGRPLPFAELRAAGEEGSTRGESYRLATQVIEAAVRRLRAEARPDARASTPQPPAAAATLTASGKNTEQAPASVPAQPEDRTTPVRPERRPGEAGPESKGDTEPALFGAPREDP